MVDFMSVATKTIKGGAVEVYPTFHIYPKSSELMVRGKDFYAIWLEDKGLWSTDESDALQIIDNELYAYARDYEEKLGVRPRVSAMRDADSGQIDKWHKFCQKQLRESFTPIDETLIFANTETTKESYASKKLPYPLEKGSIEAYDKIISTLYDEEERRKIEWAIGAVITGESKYIQKFLVFYGDPGSGKSTILNIIEKLFEGYYAVFDAKALGSSNNAFALEAFRSNPLVAIQHDGDLSRIEDNTRLNSLVSHEEMTINEKFKATYTSRFNAFLFLGTNKPVKITDGKSGLIRRLIDVTPSGRKLQRSEYNRVTRQIPFELGAIAYHCKEVFLSDPGRYDDYIPTKMLGASNDFYNFIIDSYHIFKKEDGTTLKAAWEMYKTYCEEARVPYPLSQRNFKEELQNYFWEFQSSIEGEDGTKIKQVFKGFRTDKFDKEEDEPKEDKKQEPKKDLIELKEMIPSLLDYEYLFDCPAQYAGSEGAPVKPWDKVKTTLKDIDTTKLHYVRPPENHIVIDFDIKDENGEKSLEKNLEAASKFPPTYAEVSKSGKGVHLHYIYNGDVTKLSSIYDVDIEVKKFTGKSSLRRLLTLCNGLAIATISSGLPLKEESKMIKGEIVQNERIIRTMIKRNLAKEIHPSTKCSIDFINKILDDAYNSGVSYDVRDMKNAVLEFAANSSNQSAYCIKLVSKMKFKSEEPSEWVADEEAPIAFYDIEVFPNLFLVNYMLDDDDAKVVRLINPGPKEIENLLKFRLIGFNCRRYDNHILYAALLGKSNEELFDISNRIVNSGKGNRDAFFAEAYNLSYTDVYDFAAKKQSLKKWEIELGIHHMELGLPWDQPVPEDMWLKVAEYCDNDVIATRKVFHHLKGDWTARQILAELAGMSVNDTTNTLTTRIVFGKERKPKLIYTDLATGEQY